MNKTVLEFNTPISILLFFLLLFFLVVDKSISRAIEMDTLYPRGNGRLILPRKIGSTRQMNRAQKDAVADVTTKLAWPTRAEQSVTRR